MLFCGSGEASANDEANVSGEMRMTAVEILANTVTGADLVFWLEMLENGLEAIGEVGHYAIYAG